jgi:hypothetical protein
MPSKKAVLASTLGVVSLGPLDARTNFDSDSPLRIELLGMHHMRVLKLSCDLSFKS